MLKPFPPTFRFGVATADHQCEAYNGQDDIRDVWERVRGLTARGKATDFWNRYREDVDLAKRLGCRAFRLSLSWARLEPAPGQWDDGAFEHYRDVLKYMRDAGMITVVTLHHNTWPLHVQAAGDGAGMLDRGFPDRLAGYARAVAQRLGDLIDYYVTINEPSQLVYGFIKGWWMRAYPMPPGLEPFATSDEQMDAVSQLIPNLFRAHARARAAIRNVHPNAMVGANPLILGLPRWVETIANLFATRIKSPHDLRRQAKRFSRRKTFGSGTVDISIAQLTMTQRRMDEVLFSEPYFIAHLSALHTAGTTLPSDFAAWTGRVGVTSGTAPCRQGPGFFPRATIQDYPDSGASVDGLKRGEIDLVFDDDVVLSSYARDGLSLAPIPANDQPFCVALALGSRALLNAVDLALREFKQRDAQTHLSAWDRALDAAGMAHGDPPASENRKTVASVGRKMRRAAVDVPDLDKSLRAIRKRGVLRVGIHPGVPGLCTSDGAGGYAGLEPELARFIAARILGKPDAQVQFVSLTGQQRLNATRSWLGFLDPLLKSVSLFTTIVGANWWNLGMAGKLPHFLCPPECVGALDYVGLDYYWGVPALWPGKLHHLAAASECRYANAPVWPNILFTLLREEQQRFPGKPIIVIENGCVTSADGVSRADYVNRHVAEVQRAVAAGVPVEIYLCWSITSNREWGLPFDNNSDFGLYYIDLDRDQALTRVPTPASERYAAIIAARSAQ